MVFDIKSSFMLTGSNWLFWLGIIYPENRCVEVKFVIQMQFIQKNCFDLPEQITAHFVFEAHHTLETGTDQRL